MRINKVLLLGRLTSVPELKSTQSGMAVLRFTIAVNRIKKDEVDFIRCVAFKNTAETISKYFTKGSAIFIEGSIQVDAYEKNGEKINSTSVIVDRFDFVERKVEKPAINVRVDDGLEEVEEIDLSF